MTISGSYLSEDYVGLKWCVNRRHPGWLGVWTCSSIAANLVENAALNESVVGTFRTWRGVRVKSAVRSNADVTRLRDVSDVLDDVIAL
jgi:hypothetical protein